MRTLLKIKKTKKIKSQLSNLLVSPSPKIQLTQAFEKFSLLELSNVGGFKSVFNLKKIYVFSTSIQLTFLED